MITYTVFTSLTSTQGTRHSSTWADLAMFMQQAPTYPDKKSQPLIKLGVFDGDSRGAGHSLDTISGIELDYDDGKVTVHSVANLLRDAGIECVVCSTYTSRLDRPKWRVFAPTSRELPADLRQYLAHALDAVIGNVAAPESFTPKQTFFFGRNPAETYVYMHINGQPVDVVLRDQANAAYQADKRAQAAREQLAATLAARSEQTRKQRQGKRLVNGQLSPIDSFNDAHSVAAILTAHGYRLKGKKWLSPQSQSGMAGVVILAGQDGRERAFSHGASDVLADGLAHDCFDLYRIFDHGGDEWAAIQAAARLMTTSSGESIHLYNRHAYRTNRTNSKAQAALDKIKGVAV